MRISEEAEKNRISRQKRLLILLIAVLILNIVNATIGIIKLVN